MVETEPAIRPRPIAADPRRVARRRAEFARQIAARLLAHAPAALDPAVEARGGALSRAIFLVVLARHAAPSNAKAAYIGAMTDPATAPAPISRPLVEEIRERLVAALEPTALTVSNDSAQHAGHLGDDGTGESHFSVSVEAAIFSGLSRVARQRLVNQALADLLRERIHALAIRASAPGE
jgi:BolA family transcriptional regulator, general stress-responsive regulator